MTVFLFYALFDFLPKMLFRMFPTRLCVLLARPFRWVHFILRPLVAGVEWASGVLLRWRGGKVFTGHLFGNREELRLVMQDSTQTLTSEERGMINRVLDLQTLTVRQVMSPLSRAVTTTTQSKIALMCCGFANKRNSPVFQSGQPAMASNASSDCSTLIRCCISRSSTSPDWPGNISNRPCSWMRICVWKSRSVACNAAGQRLAIVLARDRREIGILSLPGCPQSHFW